MLTMCKPVALLINLHVGLFCSLVYVFLKAFPVDLGEVCGCTPIKKTLAFLSQLEGVFSASAGYVYFLASAVETAMLDVNTSPELVCATCRSSARVYSSHRTPDLWLTRDCNPLETAFHLRIFGWRLQIPDVFFLRGVFCSDKSYSRGIGVCQKPFLSLVMNSCFLLFATIMYRKIVINSFLWGGAARSLLSRQC